MPDTTHPTNPFGFRWHTTYTQLPDDFYTHVQPTPVAHPSLAVFNPQLADELGLDANALQSPDGLNLLAGNTLPPGTNPLAQAYAGHQFGNFTTLGDGRAILLGEHLIPSSNPKPSPNPNPQRVDLQLKGPGPTPYSRGGDGRAALGPMLREYLLSEALHALNIPTTRAIAVIRTGQPVQRQTPLPGAILTRIAPSHLRVGTFEYAARFLGTQAVQALADHTLQRHAPHAAERPHPYRALFQHVAQQQANLLAQWQSVGFVHGVMNTDNTALAGHTLDYGPCAFLDAHQPDAVFSSIDQLGRYAFANQPRIAQWNLARLAETLLPLFDTEPNAALAWAQETINQLHDDFQHAWLNLARKKLGLFNHQPQDQPLVDDLLALMHQHHADHTNTFRVLANPTLPDENPFNTTEFQAWHPRWQHRLQQQNQSPDQARQLMRQHNPALIPRNHAVETALQDAVERDDPTAFNRLHEALKSPYDDHPKDHQLRQPPAADAPPYRTFCGT